MIRHNDPQEIWILAICQKMFDLGKGDLSNSIIVGEWCKLFIVRFSDQASGSFIVEDPETGQSY